VLRVQADVDAVHYFGVLSTGRGNGREEKMRGVGFPVQPVEFPEDGNAGADENAVVEVV
jgi:hypothetical protein